jgi:hypothetical protein
MPMTFSLFNVRGHLKEGKCRQGYIWTLDFVFLLYRIDKEFDPITVGQPHVFYASCFLVFLRNLFFYLYYSHGLPRLYVISINHTIGNLLRTENPN